MADKLKIDINSTTSAGTTRPTSAASSRDNVSIGAEPNAFESFKGMGSTLNGRVTKGKGKARKIEEVDKDSKIERTECVYTVYRLRKEGLGSHFQVTDITSLMINVLTVKQRS